MREILFRGKQLDNGEWVYGYYVKGATRHCILLSLAGYPKHDVDPSTVGQYTGLKDKNDKQIFEGDILKRPSLRLGGPETRLLINDIRKIDRIVLWVNEWEIIGNIHDNPELMEEPAIIAREREHV